MGENQPPRAVPTLWVLTDGKAGDEVQCLGVAKRMDNNDEFTDGTTVNGYFRVGYAF